MCGILGIYDNVIVSQESFIKKLKKIQHRGQESFGYSYCDETNEVKNTNNNIKTDRYLGTIEKNIKEKKINNFNSNIIIGHTRYSTSGRLKKKKSYKYRL